MGKGIDLNLKQIITLASPQVRLFFNAMERSLRDTGCHLPIRVIPYNEDRFDLPPGSTWWGNEKLCQWLESQDAKNVLRKYQCFLEDDYLFVDTDVCFLNNPENALADTEGFVASCTHWRNPGHTTTSESEAILRRRTTLWQQTVFNSGQFACNRALFDLESLKKTIADNGVAETCLHWPVDQPGINLLVALSEVSFTNLTLPPRSMESTWAGDYQEQFDLSAIPEERRPFLIHWAGSKPTGKAAVDSLFYDYLTVSEAEEYRGQVGRSSPLSVPSRMRRTYQSIKRGLRAMRGID